MFVLGANILSHSRTQATVALSSGEAELYAIGSGTAAALFVRSLVEESKLFQKANLCVFTDSNVGKSIASRFGASRIRQSMLNFVIFLFRNLLLQAWFESRRFWVV